MILSSLYHTFTCHSQQWSENCLTLDLIGITMALLATYLSGIYYAFWCEPFWRDFYLTTVGGLFIVATMAQFFPGFGDDKYSNYRIGNILESKTIRDLLDRQKSGRSRDVGDVFDRE